LTFVFVVRWREGGRGSIGGWVCCRGRGRESLGEKLRKEGSDEAFVRL
jgi:hypothetical protein